jgi:putative MATE family efflux protein
MPKEKSLLKETIQMAWPTVFENVAAVIVLMIDTFMVASLGRAAVAATGLTAQPKFFLMAPVFALNAATGAIIARKRGEGDRDKANTAAKIILSLALGYSLVIGLLCIAFGSQIVELCGGNSDTSTMATLYFKVNMGFLAFTSLTMMCSAIQRSMGNTKIAMYAHVASMVINVVFNYLLIYGHFGFPKLGVLGAALATVLGTIVSFGIVFYSLKKQSLFINLGGLLKSKIREGHDILKSVLHLSTNFMSEDFIKRFSFLLIGIMAAKTGTEPFAAHQVGMSLLNLAFALGLGMQVTSVTLAGNAIGQKNIPLARTYTKNCLLSGLCLGLVAGLLIYFWGENFFAIYFTDVRFLSIGKGICQIVAFILPIQICQVVYSGSLRASGDIRYTLIASTITLGVLNVAIDFVLTIVFDFGIQGIWIGTLAAQTTLAVMHLFRFSSNKWEKKKI